MVQGRAESATWRWRLQTLRKEAEEAGGVNLKPRAVENKNKRVPLRSIRRVTVQCM